MTDERNKAIRMGVGKPRRFRRHLLIAGAVALLVVTAAIVILSSGGEAPLAKVGCPDDEACGPGKICLVGGCILLLASEHPGIWHDEVQAQLDAKGAWHPKKAFGEKLMAADRCPAPTGSVPLPAIDKMRFAAEVHLFELGPSEITWYRFLRVKGRVWIDALRFYYPSAGKPAPQKICGSDEVAAVSIGSDARRGPYVDVSLAQAAPAGADAKAAVSWKRPAPKPDRSGRRRFTFSLAPLDSGGKRFRTVLALPLGSDLWRLNGPPPADQRLARGFVTYYWAHTTSTSDVSVEYKTSAAAPYPLDIRAINP